jgi:hypothetical protein
MHLNRVVFPHPEGPIRAVTQFLLKSISMFFNASLEPNQACKEEIESLDSLLLYEMEELSFDTKDEEDSVSGFLLFEDFKMLNMKPRIKYGRIVM